MPGFASGDPAAASERISFTLLSLPSLPAALSWRLPRPVLDLRAAPMMALAAESQRLASLAWRYTEEWRQLRGGVGLDVEIADAGNLHLTLVPARDSEVRGLRWLLDADGGARGTQLWSIGASFDLVRTMDYDFDAPPSDRDRLRGSRRVILSPQLLLDVDRLARTAGNAQLTVQHSNWREHDSRRALPGRVWQFALRWRF